MRVLVTACPAPSHLFPLVPLCWALRTAGHEVAVAVPGQFAPVVRHAGLSVVALPEQRVEDAFGGSLPVPGRDLSPEEAGRATVDAFTALAGHGLGALDAVVSAWRPDLVLHDPMEMAGPACAAARGVPAAVHQWGVPMTGRMAEEVATATGGLSVRLGGPAAVPAPVERLDVCPPGLQDAGATPGQPLRYVPFNGAAVLPPWLVHEAPARPRVAVTVGSTMGDSEDDAGVPLLATVLEGLADLDVEPVVALGDLDVSALGTLPEATRLERWLPLSSLLPTCDAVVHHGGAGTTMTAVAAGLPQLALPTMADQFLHAERLAAHGAGHRLAAGDRSPAAVASSVTALLAGGEPAEAAEELRDEVTSMPAPDEVAELLAHAA